MSNTISPEMQKHLSKSVNINFSISIPDLSTFKSAQNQMATQVSSMSTFDPKSDIPIQLVQEHAKYRKLLKLYRDRFEKWPDAEMREILFKQAIKFTAEIDE